MKWASSQDGSIRIALHKRGRELGCSTTIDIGEVHPNEDDFETKLANLESVAAERKAQYEESGV